MFSPPEAALRVIRISWLRSAKELMKATGWQPHSLRGFLSGTIRKKMGMEIISAKREDGERSYSIKA